MNNWLSIEKYPKLFHQYELFYEQIKQPLFRKRFLIQILIVLNSFINPVNIYQKSMFNFSLNQKEKIYILSKNCIEYLQKKYNIFINDLVQNENIWSKWKEKNCPEINKRINLKENKDKIDKGINTKIQEVKSLFNNYNIDYVIKSNSNFINNINSFKETKLDSIKFSESIEGLNSEVPFFGTYLEQIYKDLDPEEEEENTKERVLNNMPSFSWKFLRLLSEGDINKINAEEVYKLLSISEDYYKNFAPKDTQVKFNFKILTPPPIIELKPKEEISLPKELIEQNQNVKMNLKEVKEETSEEATTNNKPVISLPIDLIEKEKTDKNNIINNSNIKNNIKINDITIIPKKEEVKETIRLPSNLKLIEIKNKEENEKNINISNINNENKIKIEEKKIILVKNEIESEKQINNNKNGNLIKESIPLPKEFEKNNIDKKIISGEIKNINITNIENNKHDDEKKKELNDKSMTKKFKEENNNQNKINNNKQVININQNLNINDKSINAHNKEKEIIKKENIDINKNMKISDSTIPAGIINISKDSKNPSLISKESKSLIIENISISKENKKDTNLKNKEEHTNAIINNNSNNNKISNYAINKNIKENNSNINNKVNYNTKVETNNYHNSNSKVFTDRKSPDKNLLNNISSGNKINNNGNNMNRSSSNMNKNRQEMKTNRYDHKYNNKYENKYSNKSDDANYDNKYNNKYDNKYNDKYVNKYDNNKYDFKNDNKYDNKYGDKYDNNYNYKYENNNNNYKYDHYDNRYRYDNNKGYDRSQEKDNHFINKKRYNDEKYDNYMSSLKKRK